MGINAYEDTRVQNLSFARADAEALASVLTDPAFGAFPNENVSLLLDEAATRRGIVSAIGTQLSRTAGPEDLVCVFFAGHGATDPDPTSGTRDGLAKYLLPHDTDLDDLFSTAVPMRDVERFFGRIGARQIVFMLDACYSGGADTFGTRSVLTPDFLERLTEGGEGRLVMTSCRPNEVSLEDASFGGGHGLFSHYLLQGLKGDADTDGDGLVSLDELYEYVHRHVSHHARKMGGAMSPIRTGSAQGDIFLTWYRADGEEPEAREQAKRRRSALVDLNREGRIPDGVLQLALKLLRADPGDLTPDDAFFRAKVQALTDGELDPVLFLDMWSTRTGEAVPEAFRSRPGRETPSRGPDRLDISYDVEIGGRSETRRLPFVVGVLADVGGTQDWDQDPLPLRDRPMLDVTRDTLDEAVATIGPVFRGLVQNALFDDAAVPKLNIVVDFECMEDFEAHRIILKVGPLRQLHGAAALCAALEATVADPLKRAVLRESMASREITNGDLVEISGYQEMPPGTAWAHAVSTATYDEESPLNAEHISWDSTEETLALLAARRQRIGELVSAQVDLIMGHPDFMALESTWRSLARLVEAAEAADDVQVRLLGASLADLRNDLDTSLDMDRSRLFHRFYTDEHGTAGGRPFGLIVADYAFSQTARDVEILTRLGSVGEAAGTPILGGVAPTLLGLETFRARRWPRDITRLLHSTGYDALRALRETSQADYLFLALPSVLLAAPREPDSAYDTACPLSHRGPGDPANLLWGNAAYALAECVVRGFVETGSFTRLSGLAGGGLVEGVLAGNPGAGPSAGSTGPTDAVIDDARASELSDLGLVPLTQIKGTARAVFRGAFALSARPRSGDVTRDAAEHLARQLHVRLVSARMGHFVKSMLRDLDGHFRSAEECEAYMNAWLKQWTDPGDRPLEAERVLKPLQEARIDVMDVPGRPGSYQTALFLKPHY